jgi:hypothetical protein
MATMLLLTLLNLCLFCMRGAHAAVMTRIIDDETGDSVTGVLPVYSPPDAWVYGPTCGTNCHVGDAQYVLVDTTNVYGGSWHETTYGPGRTPPSISLSFTGEHVKAWQS